MTIVLDIGGCWNRCTGCPDLPDQFACAIAGITGPFAFLNGEYTLTRNYEGLGNCIWGFDFTTPGGDYFFILLTPGQSPPWQIVLLSEGPTGNFSNEPSMLCGGCDITGTYNFNDSTTGLPFTMAFS